MAISIRGNFENPTKSPWNFEKYDSLLEKRMMERLEGDPHVVKWMKRHSISIPWINGQRHRRRYRPDFLVEYADGSRKIIEVKDSKSITDSNDVQRKRRAAEMWCKQRGMEYELTTMD